MLAFFRAVSLMEGLSYLTILSISFGYLSRDYVSSVGMIHGILFMLYLVISLQVSNKMKWSVVVWLGLFIASIVPFGFIAVEGYIRKQGTQTPLATE